MGGLFKKLFKDDTGNVSGKDKMGAINPVSSELKAQTGNDSDKGADTNRLLQPTNGYEKVVFNEFINYMFFSESNCGMVRQSNQDSIFTGVLRYHIMGKSLAAGIGIIADGMGGLSAGEIASSTAVESISMYMYARLSEYIQDCMYRGLPHSSVILGHLSSAAKNANKVIRDKGVSIGEKIGTTFTGLFLFGGIAYFGHAGDSRAYLIDTRRRSIEKVTKDHSLVGRLVEIGHITDEEAKNHPRRNEIYKMLGLNEEIEIDTFYRIINSDSVIVLMSDGLWEFISDNEMLNEIVNSSDYSRSARILVDMANKNGGFDNISLVIVKPIK